MGQVEDGAGALVKHIGIEAFRPEERTRPCSSRVFHSFQAGKLAGKHGSALLQTRRAPSRP